MVPATCVPCPLSSRADCPLRMQFFPLTALRSGCARSMPLSMTATLTVEASRVVVVDAAPRRRTHGGAVAAGAQGPVPGVCLLRAGVLEIAVGAAGPRAGLGAVSAGPTA